jgi:hypothetical protein
MIPLKFGPFRRRSGIPLAPQKAFRPFLRTVLERYFADLARPLSPVRHPSFLPDPPDSSLDI